MNHRNSIFAVAFALTTISFAANVFSQPLVYPKLPIKFVVPFAAGGAATTLAHAVGQHVSERLGQPVVVENKPGAGGAIAAKYVAESNPDGYTVFVGSAAPLAINKSLYSKLPYDPAKDFAAVSLAALVPNVLVVNPNLPATTVAELLALCRSKPGVLTYASSGNGTTLHLAGELFKKMTKIDIVHVPYKGGAPAITDLLGGRVDFMFAVLPDAISHIRAGRLRAIAVAGNTRSNSLPDLPTVSEAGVPGFEASAWYGFVVPVRTPTEIVHTLNSAINAALARPEIREKLAALGFEAAGSTPQQFKLQIESEIAKWAAVVESSGARID